MIFYINNKQINTKICTNIKDRFLGLMFKKEIIPMYFPKCNSIHTFFMKQNIDVVMMNKDNKVIAIYQNIPKNKIIINHKAYNTLELPVYQYNIKIGDILKNSP